jgi:hypothetical protein
MVLPFQGTRSEISSANAEPSERTQPLDMSTELAESGRAGFPREKCEHFSRGQRLRLGLALGESRFSQWQLEELSHAVEF